MSASLRTAVAALVTAAATSFVATPALAQEQEEEGPGPRYVAVTIFEVPLEVRGEVLPYMREYVLPEFQLNPNVLNFRLLIHNWGGDASQVVLYSEYENFGDIGADCGAPCQEYQEQHPMPEEGDAGYEEFRKAQERYLKYFSKHHDEIYSTPMGAAKVEGELQGPVGPPEEEGGGST